VSVGDTYFDVLAIARDGKKIGIEIACSAQYEEVNATKALKTDVDVVLFVCETEKLMEFLQKKINAIAFSENTMRYGFKLVNDYIG